MTLAQFTPLPQWPAGSLRGLTTGSSRSSGRLRCLSNDDHEH